MVNQDENNGRNGKQTLEKMKRSLSIQEILSREWKVGLAALLCQKNENEIALGLFIAEERNRKQARAQQATARRHTYAAWRFASYRKTARRRCLGANSSHLAAQRCNFAAGRFLESYFLDFFLYLESKAFIFTSILHFHQNCYKTMQNKHNIAKNNFWLSTVSFIKCCLIPSSF